MAAAACLIVGEQFPATHDSGELAGNWARPFALAEPIPSATAGIAAVQAIGSKPQAIRAQLQDGFVGEQSIGTAQA
jgi:hypothetical protein